MSLINPNATWRKWKIARRVAESKVKDEPRMLMPEAREPGVDGVPLDDSYARHLRGVRDVILSGPVGDALGTGRRFATKEEALYWAVDKYGEDRVKLLDYEGASRWAVLIKNLKSGEQA